MRIISKFKDYYDGVQGLGFDDSITFVRDTVERLVEDYDIQWEMPKILENFYKKFPRMCSILDSEKRRHDLELFMVGFCGNYYLGLCEIVEGERNFYYGSKEIHEFLDENNYDYNNDFGWWSSNKDLYEHSGNYRTTKNALNAFFDEFNNFKNMDLFIKECVPYFIIGTESQLNPCLRDMGFGKVKDSYTAFQEIEQFLSGVLGSGNPDMVEISNESKIEKAGFDEISFRQTSPGKKFKRRNKKK